MNRMTFGSRKAKTAATMGGSRPLTVEKVPAEASCQSFRNPTRFATLARLARKERTTTGTVHHLRLESAMIS